MMPSGESSITSGHSSNHRLFPARPVRTRQGRLARGKFAILQICRNLASGCGPGTVRFRKIMTLSSGILAGCINGQVWLRVEGKGSHQNTLELKTFVLEKVVTSRGQRVIVDLSSCTGMDSTFMGMLSRLSRRLEDTGGSLHVIHAAGRNGELLRGLGLDQLFTVDDHEEHLPAAVQVPDCSELAKEPCGREERTEICLECHEALVAADERNAPKFRDVIELMRNDRRPAMAH